MKVERTSFLIRLQPGMLDFLRYEAQRRGMTTSALVRALLTEAISR